MSYPVSYRKGAMAMSRAAKLPGLPGFQWPNPAGFVRNGPWYPKVGGALALFRFSAPGIALGVGLAGVKFINWWMTRPEGLWGYTAQLKCKGYRGVFYGSTIRNCLGGWLPADAPDNLITTGRPATLYEWQFTGETHPVFGYHYADKVAWWVRTVTAGPAVNDPAIRVPPIYVPLPATVANPAGFGNPVIAPPATVPKVPTLPEASVGGQPSVPMTVPRPMTGVYVWSPGAMRPGYTTVPTVRSVPDTLTQEKKLKMSKGMQSLILSFNATTEYADMVDALFDGLETSPCKSMAGAMPNTAAKADAIIRCAASQMNWSQAVFNLIWANVEDAVWAKMGLPTKQAGMSYGTNAPVNIAIGMAMGDSLADNFKVLKNRGSEAVRDVERITRKAVDILIDAAQRA